MKLAAAPPAHSAEDMAYAAPPAAGAPAPLPLCAEGRTIPHHRYRAFGARTDISGIAPARQDPSFQNRTFDAGLGIYDYRNRSFDPATGRFLQRDPVMGGDELFNPYCFPGNNAVGRLDAMGLGDPAPVEAYIEWLRSEEGGMFSEEEMKPFLIKLRALEEAGYSFEIEAPGPFTFGATGRGDKKIIVYRKKDKTAMGAWATEQLCLGKEAREFRVAVMNPQIGIVGAIGSVLIDKPTEELDKARGLHPETAPLFGQERVAEDVYLQHVRSTVASEERAYAADKEIYEQVAYSAGTAVTVRLAVCLFGGTFGRILMHYGDDAARAGGGKIDDLAKAAARRLPANARTTRDTAELFRRLQKFHGIDPALASERLHELKKALSIPANGDLVFDLTGNIYDPATLEWLGSLTEGGAKLLR